MAGKSSFTKSHLNHRAFLAHAAVASAGLVGTATGVADQTPALAPAAGPVGSRVQPGRNGVLPKGQIGNAVVSRLISGGNLLSGWCHQRDLLFVRNLAAAYLTEQKQFDTLQLLEESGVNSIMVDMIQLDAVNKYKRDRGGRIQTIVAVREDWGNWSEPDTEALQRAIRETAAKGPNLLYLHGGYTDRLVEAGKPRNLDTIAAGLDFIRKQGFPAGLGAHELEVLKACDHKRISPDFYVKTFHHDRYWSATPRERRKPFTVDGPRSLDHNEFHDNIFCLDAEATSEYMVEKEQPWIAFKVLAAGAITPKSGFRFAFENGADFIAVGMFDFEVKENLGVLKESLSHLKRERPWRGTIA